MNEARYFRNINDGIIILDNTGTIVSANPSAVSLLGLEEDYIGKKYSDFMLSSGDSDNDAFHQVVIDSIMEIPQTCQRKVSYRLAGGETRLFQLTSSYVKEENAPRELIISFSDITETTKLMRHRERASIIFASLLSFLSLWILLYALWQFLEKPFSAVIFSKMLVFLALILSIFFVIRLKLKPEECGLRYTGIKNVIVKDLLIAAAGAAILIGLKLLITKLSPDTVFYCADGHFFDFTKYKWYNYILYACSVISQEFCSRGIIHEQARIVISSRYSEELAIIVSSLVFAALHVQLGLVYMLGAAVLLGILGVVYKKQGTIWGLCIPHFVFGEMLGILGFVVF